VIANDAASHEGVGAYARAREPHLRIGACANCHVTRSACIDDLTGVVVHPFAASGAGHGLSRSRPTRVGLAIAGAARM
jgi:hypothetical protein